MMKPDMYKVIKKQNGEAFAKAIRDYHSGIFDIPDIDKIVKYAGREAEPIMGYLISLKDVKPKKQKNIKNPFDLLNKAGYDAYYADTVERQNAISPYFAKSEELCTFRDPTRHERYHIINCVKKNVDEIKRENFKTPEREDEYGTSVISIQILRYGGFISIKNRYNHAVVCPDNTFDSNPDNIIEGLSQSLKSYFDVDFSTLKINMPDYYAVINNKVIKYNHERNNIYTGEDFYTKDGKIHKLSNDQIMLDYFVLNWKTKEIMNLSESEDGFHKALAQEIKGKKLRVLSPKKGYKQLFADNKQILQTKNGVVESITFDTVKKIDAFFLFYNTDAIKVSFKNAEVIDMFFMPRNRKAKIFSGPRLFSVGQDFFVDNEDMEIINTPKLETAGADFLFWNQSVKILNMNQLRNSSKFNVLSTHPDRENLLKTKLKKDPKSLSLNELINRERVQTLQR